MGEAKTESVQGGVGKMSKGTLALSTVLHFVLLLQKYIFLFCEDSIVFLYYVPIFEIGILFLIKILK